jgi:hypothetical protein
MGSGSRITFGLTPGLVFGVQIGRFPFAVTLNLNIAFVWVQIGFGKGYDQ